MEYQKLDKRIIKSWKIARIITLCIFLILFSVILFISALTNTLKTVWFIVLPIMGLILLYRLVAIVVYPFIEYKQWRYLITEDKIEIRFGIFFITTTIIPIIRIQHITINAGPINRKLGLAEVEIHTASGSSVIKGLTKEQAEQISENLKEKLINRLEAEV